MVRFSPQIVTYHRIKKNMLTCKHDKIAELALHLWV